MKEKINFSIILLILLVSAFIIYKMPINLGLDLKGGMRVVLEAKDTKDIKADDESMTGILAVIRNRVDGLGVAEPVIFRKGERQVVVELAGISDKERAIKMIGDTALLEFVEAEWAPGDISVLSEDKQKLLLGEDGRLGKVIDKDSKGNVISEKAIILKKTALTGKDLKWAGTGTDQYGKPVVSLEFNAQGAQKFADVTGRSVGRPIAIILDGKIISAPNVNESIYGGKAQISGSFSLTEVIDLVTQLKAGALPIPVEIVQNSSVGASLGQDSINKSLKAGILGFIVVGIFLIIYYRLIGLLAALAMGVYVVVCFAALVFMNVTLTLPGIAGFILTIGMAVDANVIIFERIIEEKRLGGGLITSIENGFSNAMSTIIDSNITTLITAVVLFWLGTGSIKGFAVALATGIIVSMFSAIFVTKNFVLGFANLKIADSKWFIKE